MYAFPFPYVWVNPLSLQPECFENRWEYGLSGQPPSDRFLRRRQLPVAYRPIGGAVVAERSKTGPFPSRITKRISRLDTPGKDSFRHRQTGAAPFVVARRYRGGRYRRSRRVGYSPLIRSRHRRTGGPRRQSGIAGRNSVYFPASGIGRKSSSSFHLRFFLPWWVP